MKWKLFQEEEEEEWWARRQKNNGGGQQVYDGGLYNNGSGRANNFGSGGQKNRTRVEKSNHVNLKGIVGHMDAITVTADSNANARI